MADLPTEERRPDGVLLDPPAVMPPTAERAPTEGVAALREPVDPARLARLVADFFAAFQRASIDGLAALLATDAGPIGARARGRAPLLDSFRQRLQGHDYARLAGLELARTDAIRRWRYDELGQPGSPPRPADMRHDEVYVRVPVEVTHSAGERLFGDVEEFIVRDDGGELRIAGYGETDAD